MGRHYTYFGDCKSPYSAPANCKFAGTRIQDLLNHFVRMKKPLFIVLYLVIPSILFAQQWEVVLPDSVYLNGGIVIENNSFKLIGYSGNDGTLISMHDDGQYETIVFPAPEGTCLILNNLIELEDEGFFVIGTLYDIGDETGKLFVMVLDKNFIIVEQQTIQVMEGFHGFKGTAAVMDDDGTIVVLATARRANPTLEGGLFYNGALFRFSQTGECLNYRYLLAEPPDPIYNIHQINNQELMEDPFSNRIIAMCAGRNGLQSFLYFDYDLNLAENHFIIDQSIPESNISKYVTDFYANYWYNENEMLIAATQRDSTGVNRPHILIGRVDRDGLITEKTEINKPDTLLYFSRMAYANDSTIYISTRCHTVNWLGPFYPQVYLVNKDLEILGCLSFWEYLNCVSNLVLPTEDDGCVMVITRSTLHYDTPNETILRLSREDFNPIWSIKETPIQEIKANVFPNPANEEINFDLTDIPTDGSVCLRITNITGQTFIDRKVYGTGNLLTVGVTTLPIGTYTYCLYQKDKILSKGKFIKN